MTIACLRFALVAAVLWLGTLVATAQTTEQIPSAPLGGIQMTEQHIIGGIGAPDSSASVGDQPLGGLCGADRGSEAIAAACEAATLDLIRSFAASALATHNASRRATESRLDFEAQARAHTIAALTDQAARSEILFWTAMITVALGLIAAALQFRQSWTSGQSSAPTEITISEKQISIKTAWIGVVLLAMSMGFLTLYLTLVYPIEPI